MWRIMDEASLLAKFDGLVHSGLVLHDNKQEIIEKVDGGLNVSQAQCASGVPPFSRRPDVTNNA